MRATTLVIGMLISGTIIFTNQGTAHAEEPADTRFEPSVIALIGDEEKVMSITDWMVHLDRIDSEETEIESLEEADPREPEKHIVQQGDSLISIANEYEDVEWKDIWSANESLDHPDMLSVGDELFIPSVDDELEARAVPEPAQPTAPVEPTAAQQPTGSNYSSTTVSYTAAAFSAGNTYAAGYCTWYVKNRRPDLPNNLGNADTWAARAAAQGIATGSQPRVGAAAQQKGIMHVVYVEAVHDDGTVTVSEMNWKGLHIVSTRRVAASTFTYIY